MENEPKQNIDGENNSPLQKQLNLYRHHPEIAFLDAQMVLFTIYTYVNFFTGLPKDGPSGVITGGGLAGTWFLRRYFDRKSHGKDSV